MDTLNKNIIANNNQFIYIDDAKERKETLTKVANLYLPVTNSKSPMAIYMDDFEEIFAKNPTKIESIIKHISFRIRRLTYEYVNACKMIYDAAEAELKNSVSDELKKKAQEYKENYYG